MQRAAPRHADRLPGPVRLAQPAHARRATSSASRCAIHGIGTEAERKKRVADLLETVGLNAEHAERYPHEFSGGQRQRIGIARALALNPQAHRLRRAGQRARRLHPGADASTCSRTCRTSSGSPTCSSPTTSRSSSTSPTAWPSCTWARSSRSPTATLLYDKPQHPYTEALLSAVPIPDPQTERARRRIILEGDVPSPANPPSGCVFHPRCPRAQEICTTAMPQLVSHRRRRRCVTRWPATSRRGSWTASASSRTSPTPTRCPSLRPERAPASLASPQRV